MNSMNLHDIVSIELSAVKNLQPTKVRCLVITNEAGIKFEINLFANTTEAITFKIK